MCRGVVISYGPCHERKPHHLQSLHCQNQEGWGEVVQRAHKECLLSQTAPQLIQCLRCEEKKSFSRPLFDSYDGPGVTTQTHTPEKGCLCVVKRHAHTHCIPTQNTKHKIQKQKNTKYQNIKTETLLRFMTKMKLLNCWAASTLPHSHRPRFRWAGATCSLRPATSNISSLALILLPDLDRPGSPQSPHPPAREMRWNLDPIHIVWRSSNSVDMTSQIVTAFLVICTITISAMHQAGNAVGFKNEYHGIISRPFKNNTNSLLPVHRVASWKFLKCYFL